MRQWSVRPWTDAELAGAGVLPPGSASAVLRFSGRWRWLSNFSPSRISYRGVVFPNAEALFQALKRPPEEQTRLWLDEMAACRNGLEARRAGRAARPLRDDWGEVKVGAMAFVLSRKFEAGSPLSALLEATGRRWLEEGTTWGDSFWGVDAGTREGGNVLGRLLMARRAALQQTSCETLARPL